jgi:DNA-binding MarR family transcriptional regulator
VLVRYGTVRLGALSEHLHIAPRSATEVVDALETRGLVERHPDPADRRATLVALTSRGEEVAAAIRSARAAEAEEFFARLAPGDRAALTRILDALLGQ